ncbi:locomotion defects [Carabus blaptoides fortunei]
MHPHRRRKKRPNYGIRTVEVERGPNGFGFTISGQQPCILSCIVANSPADQAGLRAGDFLISVNGLSVSKITHDAVVKLIGNSVGPIKMSIAEYYYSDSSDEELDAGRIVNSRKPKYMHKPRTHRNHKNEILSGPGENTVVVAAMKVKDVSPKRTEYIKKPTHDVRPNLVFEETNASASNVVNPVQIPEQESNPIEYKSLIGYLGTIEMPKQLLPSSRLQTVCSCIRKLRQEKRTPSAVLMTVLPSCLTLKNSNSQILAIFPASRVVYISSSSDKESRYFGLVTSAICENHNSEHPQSRYLWPQNVYNKINDKTLEITISNSCHVFVTDPKLVDHNTHMKKAESFKITCTPDIITGHCLEFPKNALYVVSLVQNMYRLQDCNVTMDQKNNPLRVNNLDEAHLGPLVANSPQPSASSNSDSGIGFRDDCGNVSDRILVVEFPAQRPLPVPPISTSHRPLAIDGSIIPLDTFDLCSDTSPYSINNVRAKSNFAVKKNLDAAANTYELLKNRNPDVHLKYRECLLNNVRACDDKIPSEPQRNDDKSEVKSKEVTVDQRKKQHDWTNRLTVRAMPDPVVRVSRSMSPLSSDEHCRNADVDTGQIFSERPVDVPELSVEKTYFETASISEDFKSSVDNISVHSTKSFDLNTIKTVFKTPSTKYLDSKMKHAAVKHGIKLSSCENLSPNNYDDMLTYKLSAKDLYSWTVQDGNRRTAAVSEPDVRIQRDDASSLDHMMCEDAGPAQTASTGGAASWAGAFEKLLDDPLGVQIFAEFLKKEFSAENIFFWTACERFRRQTASAERTAEAQRIYRRHLCVGAPEPVNVDSQGRQYTQQALQDAEPKLFEQAQKQIFNLMKFDSYPRFLKSDLYKQCLTGTVEYPQLETGLLLHPPNSTPSKLKKSLSNAEDRRRKSLLPWHRKNRSKSKDRGETEYNNQRRDGPEPVAPATPKNGTAHHNGHSSQSSLTSLDLAMSCTMQDCASSKGSHDEMAPCTMNGKGATLCRVILNNSSSTSVVQIRPTETVRQLANRLLDKRGLNYSAYEVHLASHPKAIDLNEMSSTLAGCEVVIEQRVVFKLDLPNRKVISVKSKSTKILLDVLRPILHKYGYGLDSVQVTMNTSEPVDVTLPVTSVDGRRLHVHLLDDSKNSMSAPNSQKQKTPNPSLDEITNKVFEQLLQEKSETSCGQTIYDRGSVKSEDWGSEHSSGIFGRFLRRDSAMHERKKKMNVTRIKGNSTHSSVEDVTGEQATKKPLIAKWKAGVKLQVACSESDELYEGLKRAQRCRLEDQRGTEINFELPDFLKDKENAQSNNKLRKLQQNGGTVNGETARFYDTEPAVLHTDKITPVASARNLQLELQTTEDTLTASFHQSTVRLTPNSPTKITDETTRSCPTSPSKGFSSLENSLVDIDTTLKPSDEDLSLSKIVEPPPLPPKPKVLPMKPSNWGQTNFFKLPRDVPAKALPIDRSKHTLYLEHSTSSFV